MLFIGIIYISYLIITKLRVNCKLLFINVHSFICLQFKILKNSKIIQKFVAFDLIKY